MGLNFRRDEAKPFVGGYRPMAQFARLKPATLLIVENEEIIRLELAYWFMELGLAVLEAKNADDAIGILDSVPAVEVLLTDIRMPGSMDGLRLAHHVRHRWPPVKIIVISGLIDTRSSELPTDSFFLPKPLDRETLWRTLARFTDNDLAGPPSRTAA